MKSPVVRTKKESGAILILGTLSLLFIIPMMGLAIDVSFLYAVKSRMQASVDGAALAAARALNIGTGLSAQTTSAQNNAVTWFYANFPNGYFGTTNTVMTASNVQVYAGTGAQAQVRNVTVSATTQVSAFFMRWLGFTTTTVAASGNASRRTVVAMIVLDRSGSMCNGGSNPCPGTGNALPCSAMVSAAKVFTGQFAAGSDYIGLVSFSDNAYIHSVPTSNFQTVLGYSNASGSGTGQLDTISCNGGTSTAEGMSLAYQALSQSNLQGALNVILLETDGLPNTLAMNFWDNANAKVGLLSSSGCKDTASKTVAGGGFKTSAVIPTWTSGLAMNGAASQTNGFNTSNAYTSTSATTTGYYPDIPAGMIAAVASTDPGGGNAFFGQLDFWTKLVANSNAPGQSTGSAGAPFNSTTYLTLSGCGSTQGITLPADIGWFPSTDIFGNSLNTAYQSVTTDAYGHITQSASSPSNWNNFHAAVLNATDNSAYVARSNATIPATIFAIGLGGNSVLGPPDPPLLPRMANDPNGDEFNTTGPDAGGAFYLPCTQETGCTTYTTQPQGTFIYAPNSSALGSAFLRISSQVLRLSK